LYELIQRKIIIIFIKSQRLEWLGHVERMPKETEVTRIYKWKPFASRPIGRPKNRWEDDVRKDLQTVKVKNWKKSALNRDLWKTVIERTKTHIELWRYQEEEEEFVNFTHRSFYPQKRAPVPPEKEAGWAR
jgi:hypothetical protein